MKQEGQDITNHKTFAKGEPEHLVLAQTKPLPDPLDVGLVPQQDRVGLRRLVGFLTSIALGFLPRAHTSILIKPCPQPACQEPSPSPFCDLRRR